MNGSKNVKGCIFIFKMISQVIESWEKIGLTVDGMIWGQNKQFSEINSSISMPLFTKSYAVKKKQHCKSNKSERYFYLCLKSSL